MIDEYGVRIWHQRVHEAHRGYVTALKARTLVNQLVDIAREKLAVASEGLVIVMACKNNEDGNLPT
jgi:hypothetical protein